MYAPSTCSYEWVEAAPRGTEDIAACAAGSASDSSCRTCGLHQHAIAALGWCPSSNSMHQTRLYLSDLACEGSRLLLQNFLSIHSTNHSVVPTCPYQYEVLLVEQIVNTQQAVSCLLTTRCCTGSHADFQTNATRQLFLELCNAAEPRRGDTGYRAAWLICCCTCLAITRNANLLDTLNCPSLRSGPVSTVNFRILYQQ